MMFSRGDDRFPFFTSTALTCPGAAVQTLVEKGSAQRLEGEPARYAAVKMEEFARLKQTQLDQALACLKELIPPLPPRFAEILIEQDGGIKLIGKREVLAHYLTTCAGL